MTSFCTPCSYVKTFSDHYFGAHYPIKIAVTLLRIDTYRHTVPSINVTPEHSLNIFSSSLRLVWFTECSAGRASRSQANSCKLITDTAENFCAHPASIQRAPEVLPVGHTILNYCCSFL